MGDNPSADDRSRFRAADSLGKEESKITRREWLLRLGGTSVLMGIQSGPLIDVAAALPTPADQLPPGLYAPSVDHMTHALESDTRFYPFSAGSETDFVRPPSGPFQPQFFSTSEFPVVKRLIALMLGESGGGEMEPTILEIAEWIDLVVSQSEGVGEAARSLSPQHRTLASAYHGEEAVAELETLQPQKTWREGLEWISTETSSRWKSTFLNAPEASQVELLQSLSGRPEAESAGTRLFALLRHQVTHGFYTSQRGLKELDYKGNAFYAESPGCSSLKVKSP